MSDKICTKCNIKKSLSDFRICRLYKGMSQGEYFRSECKSCEKKAAEQLVTARKTAPSKTESCQCCEIKVSHLVLDHDHSTGNFRGWVCRNCNQGIGKLGDTVEGVQKALAYLQKAI
jgi:hypothetical protein